MTLKLYANDPYILCRHLTDFVPAKESLLVMPGTAASGPVFYYRVYAAKTDKWSDEFGDAKSGDIVAALADPEYTPKVYHPDGDLVVVKGDNILAIYRD